jgi:3-oxoacyl-[acyl-carrier-protein] synthase II
MTGDVAVSGSAVLTAFGRGMDPLLSAAWTGRSGFRPVDRFDVAGRRVRVAATAPQVDDLGREITAAVLAAAAQAGLEDLSGTPFLLAAHGHPTAARLPAGQRSRYSAATFAADIATAAGLGPVLRTYTSACVAASTAVADAAAALTRTDFSGPVVVAAGYLVEPDQFAIFDAGRALAVDGQVRPFSTGRRGLVLGDGVAAMVLEPAAALRRRGGEPLAWLHGWARTGDAYHVCQPRPDGAGLARAIDAALARAGLAPDDIGYVNAHGSGSPQSDRAEAAALHRAFGPVAEKVPVSSTKSVHGQALEASGLVELAVTIEALHHGRLPVNAGYLGPDEECRLDIVAAPRESRPRYALSLNAAFGGANTALVIGVP